MSDEQHPKNATANFLIFTAETGTPRIEVRVEGEMVWLTQKLMAELFDTTPQNITLHLKNVYEEGELEESATCKEFLQVQNEGGRDVERSLTHYTGNREQGQGTAGTGRNRDRHN